MYWCVVETFLCFVFFCLAVTAQQFLLFVFHFTVSHTFVVREYISGAQEAKKYTRSIKCCEFMVYIHICKVILSDLSHIIKHFNMNRQAFKYELSCFTEHLLNCSDI